MYPERAIPSESGTCDTGASPGVTACGVVSLGVAVTAVAFTYSLVAATLAAVPDLAAAAAVYALFLVWGLTWLVLATGYQRAADVVGGDRPKRGSDGR